MDEKHASHWFSSKTAVFFSINELVEKLRFINGNMLLKINNEIEVL